MIEELKELIKDKQIIEDNPCNFKNFYGVRLPELRKIAKKIVKEEKKNIIEPVITPEITKEIPAPIENNINSLKDTYTLNDYRIFNKMLKDIREHNENNSIIIDKNLEYRLITKYSSETYDMFKTMLKIYSN